MIVQKSKTGPEFINRRNGRWAELKRVALESPVVSSTTAEGGWFECVLDERKDAKAAQSALYSMQRLMEGIDWRFQMVIEEKETSSNGSKGKKKSVVLFFRRVQEKSKPKGSKKPKGRRKK